MSLKRGLSLLALLVMMIALPGMALAYEFAYFHKCPTCGFENEPGMKFCGNCGAKL